MFSLAVVVDSDEHDKTTDHSPERHRNHVISQDAHPASRDGLCVGNWKFPNCQYVHMLDQHVYHYIIIYHDYGMSRHVC